MILERETTMTTNIATLAPAMSPLAPAGVDAFKSAGLADNKLTAAQLSYNQAVLKAREWLHSSNFTVDHLKRGTELHKAIVLAYAEGYLTPAKFATFASAIRAEMPKGTEAYKTFESLCSKVSRIVTRIKEFDVAVTEDPNGQVVFSDRGAPVAASKVQTTRGKKAPRDPIATTKKELDACIKRVRADKDATPPVFTGHEELLAALKRAHSLVK
jgi:hypothetical protein